MNYPGLKDNPELLKFAREYGLADTIQRDECEPGILPRRGKLIRPLGATAQVQTAQIIYNNVHGFEEDLATREVQIVPPGKKSRYDYWDRRLNGQNLLIRCHKGLGEIIGAMSGTTAQECGQQPFKRVLEAGDIAIVNPGMMYFRRAHQASEEPLVTSVMYAKPRSWLESFRRPSLEYIEGAPTAVLDYMTELYIPPVLAEEYAQEDY